MIGRHGAFFLGFRLVFRNRFAVGFFGEPKAPIPREAAPDSKLLAGRHTADCRQHWLKPGHCWLKIHTTILRRLKVG